MGRWDQLRALNAEWNDLPRRLLWIIGLLLCLGLALVLFPYVAPFVLAALFAWIIEPAVRLVVRVLGPHKLVRNIAAAVFVVIIAGAAIILVMALVGRVFNEVKDLAMDLPGWASTASSDVIHWFEGLKIEWGALETWVEDAFMRLLSEATTLLTTLASRTASLVARGAWQAAALLPQGILFIVLTLMGTFYMSADRRRILGFVMGLLPEKYRQRSTVFRASILRGILGQIRAALIMLLVTFAELSFGFLLMGLDYAILLALLIALLDALPVIGAGLFLIPMCLYGIVTHNLVLGIGAGLVYLMTIVMRQLLEPRIIGRQLGLYPLATMMAMYAGLHAMGVLGMLLGPLMLLLCKVALTADLDAATEAATKKPFLPAWMHGRGNRKKG